MNVMGHAVGGVAVVVEGECPGLRGRSSADELAACDTIVRLHARVSDEPLRPTGEPLRELDSWSAFAGDGTISLCVKSSSATPREVLRLDLDPAAQAPEALVGTLWYRRDVTPPLFAYPADQLLMIHALGVAGGFLAHAAALGGRDGAFLVPGPSGAGKTTMSIAAHGVGARVLSDERTVVRRARDGWLVGGTPWPGEGGYAENVSLPLRGMMLLEQSDRDELCPVTPARALALLYRCHFPPLWDPAAAERTLSNLERLVREVPAFIVRNRRGPDAARMLLDRLGGPV